MAKASTLAKDMAILLAHLGAGDSDEEILAATGWDLDRLEEARSAVLAREGQRLVGRSSEDVYVDYVIRTRRNLQQLDGIMADLEESRQGSAMVGAVLAKQTLLDRMIKTGQDLGFVERKAVRHDHAVVVAKLDDVALQELLATEVDKTRELMRRGGRNLLEIEVEQPGTQYQQPPMARELAPAAAPVLEGIAPKAPSEFQPPPLPVREPAGAIKRRKVLPNAGGAGG